VKSAAGESIDNLIFAIRIAVGSCYSAFDALRQAFADDAGGAQHDSDACSLPSSGAAQRRWPRQCFHPTCEASAMKCRLGSVTHPLVPRAYWSVVVAFWGQRRYFADAMASIVLADSRNETVFAPN
jgi:hypothetical protein